MMASSFTYTQFQPQPPSVPRMTGGKRGPSGPLIVSSSSEDEDSDTSESLPPPGPALGQHILAAHKPVTPHPTELPKSPRNVQIVELPATPRIKTGGGKFPPAPLSSPRKDNTSVPTLMACSIVAAVSAPTSAGRGDAAGDSDEEDEEDEDDDDDDENNNNAPSSPTAPGSPRVASAASPPPVSNFAHEHDHDYENVASPCSSTASGPIYVRPPGFTYHAQEVESVKSKIVRKKSRPAAVITLREDGFGSTASKREQTPPKAKPRREPLPMRLRALPQSFWQQPNVTQQVSPATMFPVLPPLCNKDTEEDIADVRPVTPPVSDPQDSTPTADCDPDRVDRVSGVGKHPVGERKITVANTDLLFKLFENVGRDDKKTATVHMKRGRPKRTVNKTAMKGLLSGNDPYLVDASSMADSLFPQLSLESSRATGSGHTGHTSLQLVTIGSGDKTVTLPSLSVEQNYPQMLSELVMHI